MTFISYAQNFEDVMLWRALKHIDHGFYIDVGAWSPDIDSVTRAFYERGWCGINIEPNPVFHKQLEEKRTRDKNLKLAVGNCEDHLIMSFMVDSGLSTLDATIAVQHQQGGLSLLGKEEVQITTLERIWQEYVPIGQEVHFLKVDVEGYEKAVLQGNNWLNRRPWIIVIEATLPMSQKESHAAWHSILLEANYMLAYSDGLNRFYLSDERSHLSSSFKYPPNVFDDFSLIQTQLAEARANAAEARANAAEAQLRGILNSKTWHLTAPIRWAIRCYRGWQNWLR